MTSQLEAATDGTRVGLDGLQKARGAVLRTRDNFSQIEAPSKGRKAGGLADNHHLIRDLAVMRANISRTMRTPKPVVALPGGGSEAIELLDDDEQNLFECWSGSASWLSAQDPRGRLWRLRRRADNDTTTLSMTEPAAAQFAAIDDAMDRFETALWRALFAVHSLPVEVARRHSPTPCGWWRSRKRSMNFWWKKRRKCASALRVKTRRARSWWTASSWSASTTSGRSCVRLRLCQKGSKMTVGA